MREIQIRRLAANDSLDELTDLLHRAFADLGRSGLNCTCVDQSPAVTAERAGRGECYVATAGGRLVGTATLELPDPASPCRWYRRPDVATLNQLAVDPVLQGSGCGQALLFALGRRARDLGHGELALNAPAPAARLVRFYMAQGFRPVASLQLPGKGYRSLVLSKTLDPIRSAGPGWSAMPRCAMMRGWSTVREAR